MQLPKKGNYSTHLPVLKAVCDIFVPRGILELGCGKGSTPFFWNYKSMAVSLENDEEWYNKMKSVCKDKENFKLIYHNVGPKINRRTKFKEVSDFSQIEKFYDNILDSYDLNFLFIDHWTSLRCKALQYLYEKFDIIAYHDAEDKRKIYKYHLFELVSDDFFHWKYCSFSAKTGILIRKKYKDKLEDFREKINQYGIEFSKGFKQKYVHKIKVLN